MTARRSVAWALIAIFAVLPYIRVGGRPLVLLDLPARRFTILGKTLLPTDALLLALGFVAVVVTIFLLTALLGRVWCGWACPQTVYLEFLFRPIERLFDGSPGRRRRGIQGTAVAKLLKHIAFVVVACFVAHTFLAYFVGVETLARWVRQSPFEHPAAFLVMAATTGLMLFDFVFFREQTCIVACPYGRFQSVMLDRHSLIIGYDERRGEPRGRLRRAPGAADDANAIALPQAPRTAGDCIDCGMCVTCCPTGIDIRRGLQMECIGCAQCIDACDAVMTRIARPKGLIRYGSQAAMEGEAPRRLRPRVVLYPTVLAAILTVFATVLAQTGGFDLTVLRGLGATFVEVDSATIGNQARIKIVNRTEGEGRYLIEVAGLESAAVHAEENPAVLAAGESRTVGVLIVAPRAALATGHRRVTIEVSDGAGLRRERPFVLQGPHGSGTR